MRTVLGGRKPQSAVVPRVPSPALLAVFLIPLCLGLGRPVLAAAEVHDCDRLAAYATDYQRTAAPVDDILIDRAEAEKACRKAASDHPDQPRFQFQLGRVLLLNRDVENGRGLVRQAAERDYLAAAYYLGQVYRQGLYEPSNPQAAFEWHLKAARGGHPDAQAVVGHLYRFGTGVEKDMTEAVRWFGKAVDQGNVGAMTDLGGLYLTGDGVALDLKGGIALLQRAVTGGQQWAQYMLGRIYLDDQVAPTDYSRAIELFTLSADQNNPFSMVELGKIYYDGKYEKKNEKKAKALFCDARKVGKAVFESAYKVPLKCF